MRGAEDQRWAAEVLLRAARDGSSEVALARLIQFLDRTVSPEPGSFREQLLTRVIIASGLALCEHDPLPEVAATIAAAEEYVLHPGEGTFDAYFAAATASYPYGAGEGCHSLGGGNDCGEGSGCRTGAGSLASVAAVIGATKVLAAIIEEVGPWIEGLQDPVIARRGSADGRPKERSGSGGFGTTRRSS